MPRTREVTIRIMTIDVLMLCIIPYMYFNASRLTSVRGKGLSPRGIIAAVETFSVPETPRFKDAQEEIAWLRSQLGGKESAATGRGESVTGVRPRPAAAPGPA